MSNWRDWYDSAAEWAGELADSITPGWARTAYRAAKKQVAKEYIEEIRALKTEKEALFKSLETTNDVFDFLRDRISVLEDEVRRLKEELEQRSDDELN